MAYKFYESTTTKNYELVSDVNVAFELTNKNKNNVYILTNLYTSSYKHPISLGLIKRVGDNTNNAFGIGTNLSILYKLDTTLLPSNNTITLIHPNNEDELFKYESTTEEGFQKFVSEISEAYLLVGSEETTYVSKACEIVFPSRLFGGTESNEKFINKDGERYEVKLEYKDGKLIQIQNDTYEKEIIDLIYKSNLLSSLKVTKIFKNKDLLGEQVILGNIYLSYNNNDLCSVKKSLYNSNSYQYDVTYALMKNESGTQYLKFTDNITATSTCLYLSGGTTGYVNSINYSLNTISINYYSYRTRIYDDETYEDYLFSYDDSLMCIKNSEKFIKTYSYKGTKLKKINVESSLLYESASKNGEFIEGKLRELLFHETVSTVDCPSGRKARVLTFSEYDTSTEDGIDYYTFDISGGKLDVFSALIYVKAKSIPSTLTSINVSFKLKFRNKAREELYSTVLNDVVVNIKDTSLWYEQFIVGQAPSTFETVELEVFNTNAYGEQVYFDVVLYKSNLGAAYSYDVNGNLSRALKGKELTSIKMSPNNKLESTLYTINSYDDKGRLIKKIDFNNKSTTYSYDTNLNLTRKTIKYENGLYETEKNNYYNSGELKQSEIVDRIETTYNYDGKRRIKSSATFEDDNNFKAIDTINYIETDNQQFGNVGSFSFQRGDSNKNSQIEYDSKGNITRYYEGGSNKKYDFTYDSLNRITSIKYDGKYLVSYKYDSKGNVVSYYYRDDDKEIRNVYNYLTNDENIPYGAITAICQDYYNLEEDYSETRYEIEYENKKLKSTINKETSLNDQYEYDSNNLKCIKKTLNGNTLFREDFKYNHFDQEDENHITLADTTYINKFSDSSNSYRNSVIGLDYMLYAKDDVNLYWTFFAPRITLADNQPYDLSQNLLNKESNITLDIINKGVTFIDNGLKFMNVPYSSDGLTYELGFKTSYSLLLDFNLSFVKGTLFKIKGEDDIILEMNKSANALVLRGSRNGSTIAYRVLEAAFEGNHIISLNIGENESSTVNHTINLYIDGKYIATLSFSSSSYLNKLVLNGIDNETPISVGAIIVEARRFLTDLELKEYVKRINEVYKNKDIELNPTNIAYNQEKYEYDEIIFNNTFESREGIKPYVQRNKDSFYSIKENFEYLPNLRAVGVGDNVYAIKGQDLRYNFDLDESGTIALRCQTFNDVGVTLLQLVNNDLNIKIEKTASNELNLIVNDVLKSTVLDTSENFKNIIITWSKVVTSMSLETIAYNLCLYLDETKIFSTSISGVLSTSIMQVYLGKEEGVDISSENVLGYIDKLVYTNVCASEEKVLEIHEHLNHDEYCCNKYDCTSRIESKTIKTSLDKTIKKEYTYEKIADNELPHTVSRVPESEILLVDGSIKKTRSYTYDDLRRVKTVSIGGVTTTYTYNNFGYLTTVSDGSSTETYEYDNFGNITNRNGLTYTYDGQLLTKVGTKTIEYDGMYPISEIEGGKLIKRYDWFGNKLLGVIGSKSYLYNYNARGLREIKHIRTGTVPESEIYYFYDEQDKLVGETRYSYSSTGQKVKTSDIIYMYDATGLLYGFRYINEDYYYDRDILGNINHIVRGNGQIVATYKYDAYGNHKVLNSLGVEATYSSFIGNINPFRYKGYYYDVETGLFMMGQRYYSPELCRSIQPADVSNLNPRSINGLNLYSYANNNPIGVAYSSSNVGGLSSGGMIGSTIGTIGNIVGIGNVGGGSKVSGFGSLGGSSFGGINWPKSNSVAMTHYTTSLIENAFIGSFFGNISYTVTTQLNDSEMFYSYSNIGNGGYSAGVGMNLGNWYGISAYVSSNLGFGTSMQLTPWITYGAEISLQDGISFSFGTISGNTTQEITANVGWGTIAGAYLVCAGIAAIPMPGARVLAGAAACVILLIDIFN